MANLTAVIGADTSKFVEEVKSAKYMLNKFINGTKQQSAEIKKNTQVTSEQVASYQRVIKSLEKVASGTMNAKQQQSALTSQIKELKIQWANLSEEAKNGDFGKSLSSTLITAQDKLKTLTTQISQTNQEMTKLNNKTTSFGGNIKNLSGISSIFKNLSVNVSGAAGAMNTLGMQGGQALGTVASKTSMLASIGPVLANPYVLAGAAIVGAGTALYSYNKNFEHTLRITSEFTGLTGDALVSLRNGIKSVADVWDKDYKEVLQAVDKLMVLYGIDGETALQIIRDGFVAGADDAGNMLSLIQQYAGSFKDAGIEASELVALIANTRSGIFDENGMQAIQMAAKNIRLMKDTTSESLKAIGVDADAMTKKLADGSMTTMQAIQEIANKLKELPPQSQEVGQVLQDVFGRQGASAGYDLITALSDVETNLDVVKGKTGDYGKSLNDLADADRRLEAAMAEMFGIAGAGWETMGTKAKTYFYEALAWCIEGVNELKGSTELWCAYSQAAINQISYSLNELAAAWESLANLDFDGVKKHLEDAFKTDKFESDIDSFYDEFEKKHKATANVIKKNPLNPQGDNPKRKKKKDKDGKGGGSSTSPEVKYDKGSLGYIEKQISDKQAKLKLAVNDEDRKRIQKEIDELTEQKKAIELSLKPQIPEGSLSYLEKQISDKQAELKLAVNDADRKRIQKEIDELTGKKNDIELVLKPVVQDKDIDKVKEKISEHETEQQYGLSREPRNKVEEAQNIAANLENELNFQNQIIKSLQEQYQLIQEKAKLGGELTDNEKELSDIYEDAKDKVEELSDAYKDAAKNAQQLTDKADLKSKSMKTVKEGIGGLENLQGSIEGTVDQWQNLSENWDDMSSFEKVNSVFSATIGTIQNVITAIESIQSVMQMFSAISNATTQQKLANDQAETQSEVGKLGVKEASAIAGATESGSSLPFPANIAAIAAGIAAVVAGFAMVFSCFAEGGIVGSGSKIGDYNLVRVNGSEMILNGTQQKHLFSLLNGELGMTQSGRVRKQDVKFVIKGKSLEGTLKNYNRVKSRI